MEIEKTISKNKLLKLIGKTSPDIPKIGDIIKGKILYLDNSEIIVDIQGLTCGIIRGPELKSISKIYNSLKIGDEIEARVIDIDNEKGILELSVKEVALKKTWDKILEIYKNKEKIKVEIKDANKGGLLSEVFGIKAFLPVSQLLPEHYPRVEGGDKNKILKRLKKFIGKKMTVQIINIIPQEDTVIISEKQALIDIYKQKLQKYKIGDIVKAKITALTNFGAFVRFEDGLEGLIHISELSWKKVDDPNELLKVGQKIKTKVIAIKDNKIFLSLKRLQENPWDIFLKKFKKGDKIKGVVTKIEPFGALIETNGITAICNEKNIYQKLKQGETREFIIKDIFPTKKRIELTL